MMEKLKMHSPNLTQDNIVRIRDLFPGSVTEARGEDGSVKLAVDFDQLRQELTESIVEGPQERYHLNWPGKREALLAANAPIAKTVRPYPKDSVSFEGASNIFIEGDNLDALKLLQETYLGKVKLIYIDPPYNTGNDFIYSDDFSTTSDEFLKKSNQKDESGNKLVANTEANGRFHSDWLSMIYGRLKLARNLLTDDGIAIISIDESEHSNLVTLGREVFGDANFCGEIIWKNSSKNDQDYVSIQHEYLVFFVKSKAANPGEWVEKKVGLDEIYKAFEGFKAKHGSDWKAVHEAALDWYKQFPDSNPIRDSKHYSWMDEHGVYFPDNISGPNDGQYVYDVKHPVTGLVCKMPSSGWRYPESTLLQRISEGLVHFGPDHTTVPNNKTYLKNTEYQSLTSMRFVDGRAASKRLQNLFGEKVFTNPKDEILLKDIFKAVGLKGNDVVLDFFAGSGTTAHAVFELNKEQGSHCKWILVQLPEDIEDMKRTAKGSAKKVAENAIKYLKGKGYSTNIAQLSKERIRLCGQKYGEYGVDVGFRALTVDTSNMTDVYYSPDALEKPNLDMFIDNIKPDRKPEDLLFQVMLDWGVDLALPIAKQNIQGKEVFLVDGNALAACFDGHGSVDEAFVKELAKVQPLRVVFRDAGFKDSSVKINVEQIFKLLSPTTEVKCI
jgi:adenine-specific DNA-methyltransferase